MDEKIISRLKALGIPELENINSLNELNGDYINLESLLPNGKTGEILEDNKKYLATQVEIPNSEECYGIAADETMIAVLRYGCEGKDSKLIAWIRLSD